MMKQGMILHTSMSVSKRVPKRLSRPVAVAVLDTGVCLTYDGSPGRHQTEREAERKEDGVRLEGWSDQ